MDFLMEMQRTQKGSNNVFIVVDRFIRLAHFFSCKIKCDASYVTSIFFMNIARIHEFILNIIFDRDIKFLWLFW